MDQAIEVTGGLLNSLSHLIIAVQVEDVGDEVESILIILYLRIKTCEIESVGEIVLINLAEILVTARGYELEAHS